MSRNEFQLAERCYYNYYNNFTIRMIYLITGGKLRKAVMPKI
jgi:hypothetical protein